MYHVSHMHIYLYDTRLDSMYRMSHMHIYIYANAYKPCLGCPPQTKFWWLETTFEMM